MANEPPRRMPIVIETRDGQRIKPACPICGAISWVSPEPSDLKPDEKFDVVLTGIRNQVQVALKMNAAICYNCGFIWNRFPVENVTL